MSIADLALEIMKEEMLDAIASLHPDLRADVNLRVMVSKNRGWLMGMVFLLPPGFAIAATRQSHKILKSCVPALYLVKPKPNGYKGGPYSYVTLKKWRKLARMRCK